MKKNILRIVLIILILCWMYIVFGFSNAGGEESTGISTRVAKFFVKNEAYIRLAEHIIRKVAHLSEYAIGGILVYSLLLTFNLNSKIQFCASWLFVVVYAITDEIHQLFIPGRTGRIVDVFIDSLGAMLGICSLLLIIKIINKLKKQNTVKED